MTKQSEKLEKGKILLSSATLSKELLVAREIFEAEAADEKPIYFNKLVERLEKKKLASRATVSKALDILFDQGIVKANWTETKDGRHVRALEIAGEAKQFISLIYKHTSQD